MAHPCECCGLLLGGDERITEIGPATNVHPTPETHFEIDPQALVDAHRAARAGGAQVVGYYHSHPNGFAEPSATDRVAASGDGRIWLIIAAGSINGWKDTPEARRAVIFALPFLRLSDRALVVAVDEEGRDDTETGAADVVRYLTRHGIAADATTVAGQRYGAETFIDIVREESADLVITGAYGHSRMRERIFGGFTQALLMQKDLNRLMAG